MGKKDKVVESLFTKEEEQLLSDFSRNVSTKSCALFYGSALMVSALPICEFIRLSTFHYPLSFFLFLTVLVCRALLEDSHDRNDALARLVHTRHFGQHIPRRVCLQKHQVHSKTQGTLQFVRRPVVRSSCMHSPALRTDFNF